MKNALQVYFDKLSVTTTSGERFTGEEAARMAFLVSKRYGHNKEAAASAWRRLLQNACSDDEFAELAGYGPVA